MVTTIAKTQIVVIRIREGAIVHERWLACQEKANLKYGVTANCARPFNFDRLIKVYGILQKQPKSFTIFKTYGNVANGIPGTGGSPSNI
jgi:hypothetical protein